MTIALDLDGTLITTGTKQSMLLRAVSRRFGIEIEAADVWLRKREGMSNQAALLDMGVYRATADAISREWIRLVETPYWQSLDRLFDDSRKVLTTIINGGETCILISARSNPYLYKQQVYQLNLSGHFEQIFCVSPTNSVAEKAEILERSSVRLFVGDSETDYEAAKLAGVHFEAVATGQRSKAFLARWGVPCVRSTLAEIFGTSNGELNEKAR